MEDYYFQHVNSQNVIGFRVKNHPFVNLLKKLGMNSAQMMTTMELMMLVK